MMRPELIGEVHRAGHPFPHSSEGLIDAERNLFIFQIPPHPFYEDMIVPPPRAIHTDLNAMNMPEPGKLLARALTPLIRVEDLLRAIAGECLRTASTQKFVIKVWNRRHATTRRLVPSRLAQRETKPRCIGLYVIAAAQTWFGRVIFIEEQGAGVVY
jgi:hypothetical protein